ncbi:MAG: indolepyruvate ferredoxin oxidoreductase subunit alpha [Methanomassiliicoccaceae archaeon]|jgi:indolepyruvate ferredoxin oxidoreductase alpha subunit|nr:indolepyruvate ferredoxin oxidoreductase subunit alpha [Methanomassiliicoccaceae archaeon]
MASNNNGKELLLGNDAITRGVIEAGVAFASTYPGTPSSEIGNNLERIGEKYGIFFEFSANEKVAMEAASAAAMSGVRSFVFMKHVGMNVAADPMMTLAYGGVRGGMVILTADDPTAHSSQNEQDNRMYAKLSLLPMLEPSTPAEAKEMVKAGFDISEQLTLPVILRTTTRVNHARGIVDIGDVRDTKKKSTFVRDIKRFVNIPANARTNRIRLLDLNKKAAELSGSSELNFIEGSGKVGVITSGVPYTYVKEMLKGVSIFKLGFTNPLPEKRIAEFMKDKEKVIVVEELEPFLEDQVLRIAKENDISAKIYGKRSGHLPMAFEYSPDTMRLLSIITNAEGTKVPLSKPDIVLPARPPTLCAGCPHRGIFHAIRKAVGKRPVIYSSDIGCYSLGAQPPFMMADMILCMGGGIGAAGGFCEATDQKVVAISGDSTFFHGGITPLVSALFNGHKFTAVILDNRTTAMTGHQPHPGTGRDHGKRTTEAIDIAAVVKGIGVKFVETVDPYDIEASVSAMTRAIEYDGLSVVIAKQACPLELKRKKLLDPKVCEIDQDACRRCSICISSIACPALMKKDGIVSIDRTQCIGCMMCACVCPAGCIRVIQ